MTTPTIICDHCESEIDVAKDPRCVVYDPSGATDVICADCRERAWTAHQRAYTEQCREAYRAESEKTITTDRVALGPHPDQPNHKDNE